MSPWCTTATYVHTSLLTTHSQLILFMHDDSWLFPGPGLYTLFCLSPQSWKKRWCLLSQTAEGVSLLYYNKQSSFTNCEAPCGVVLMRACNKLYTIPHHPKSSNMFAIEFPNRTIHFYTDRE